MPGYTPERGRREYKVLTEKYRHIKVLIPHADWAEVELFKQKLGVSYAETLRTLIQWGIDSAQGAELP